MRTHHRRLAARVGCRFVTLFVTLFFTTGPAAAQRSWDVTAGTGGWWGSPADTAPAGTQIFDNDQWFGAWIGSISVGRYWTPNIKTEVDATLTSNGERYVTGQIQPPGARTPLFFTFDQQHREGSVAALMTLQAGRNWWVHPFLQGGVSFDWDRVESEVFPNFNPSVPPLVIPALSPETTQVIRGVVGGGAKFYLSERAFFRADLRTSFGADAAHVQFRTGFGIDF